ncbi:extracellular solute-binding protein [Litchfieldia salsa]|uniref:Carbohydrate ABC transporter substrate-binding protein, CUT1 family n=1 Tax=Litchfieldia salsa TaxID=930152 RepID=A0A1H0PRM3_9BACI|nr:extracellular solute-binding protein [Litchfieldia salsa]SDP07743.1 carbohydrate ABC transporter substrate-binding protein, CUT1 family [Litchfieldia salsa]
MIRKRKVLTTLCALSIGLGSLAACSNESATNNSDESTPTKSNEPFKLSIMANLHTPEVPSDKIEKQLEEMTNTELEIQWVPDSSYEEKLSTAFATGSFPQTVFMKNQTTYLQFKEAIRDDQFWEIGPYLSEYENLSRLKEEVLKNTAVDGKVYALYQGRPLSRQGLIFRKDWADKLGLETPTTTDEFAEMARAFTEDDPDGNGKNDTFGLTDRSDLIYGAFKTVASWFGVPNGWGEKDGELLPEFMYPEYVDTMDFFKDLRAKGYMNQDFPVTSKPDQQALFKNGTAGMYVGSMADVVSLHADAVKLNPNIVLDVHNNIKGPNGEFKVWAIPGYGSLVLFPKSSVQDEEQLKGALSFFNDLMDPENANLIFWGLEGEHYSVQDGLAKAIEDTDLTDREVKPYQALEIGEPSTNKRYEGFHTYEVKAKAEELIVDNENYLIHDPTAPLDSPTIIEKGERLNQIIVDATYQYMLGQLDKDGFDQAVENWKKQGGEQIIEEFNDSYAKSK